ncbi:spore germination protein [Alkalihalobacillus sp. MEB130]|uniref:spore germination protein n=1 Tax=Alkalihalobacillus sp. MEB130 TaxID=2976704 RepID=UPI0028DEC99F|nr:spore germination protein [Alkalihalobacillus sp. MEB130]MDT8861498.1 spore germination protein [Alkalihalobacillus sp. MEB130]
MNSFFVFKKLNANYIYIREDSHYTDDLKKREFTWNGRRGICLFLETIIDEEKLEKTFFSNLETDSQSEESELKKKISATEVSEIQHINQVSNELHKGMAAVFLEEKSEAYVFDVKKTTERSVQEPENEKIVRGSHDGFVETLMTNLQLLRRRIEVQDLVIKYHAVGTETKTRIALVYLASIANPTIVKEVEEKVKSISIDMVFSPGAIEEFLENDTISPFPQMLNTERPDRVMANLIDGRIAILTDGDPTALVCPSSFFTFYQSPDDYNSRFLVGTFYRLLRMVSFLIAIFVPAIYIATVSFHFEVIPADLVLPVKSSVERIPYPPIVEAILMELTIELIREAGIRLPSPIGQTIGIVGGLVIGDAVVQAGLVSNIMIIVVAITAIASFVVPSFEMSSALRVIRFPFMFFAASFGYFGIMFCFTLLLIHLCRLESFGSPYFSPLAPLTWQDLKDSVIRAPMKKMNERPKATLPRKKFRQAIRKGRRKW